MDSPAPPQSNFPRNTALVIVLAAVLYLVGNAGTSLWDRDEPRFAQTSRQMLQSGDWVVPRFLDKVRTAKPVFIYWCQAAAMRVIGEQGNTGVFSARLPSAIAMTIVLIILALALRRVVDPERTFWTILILATSVLTLWCAKASTTDAVLLVGITVSQMCLYAIWRGRGTWPVIIVLAIAIAEAGLTKGPVVLGVMAMTLVALGVFRWIDHRLALRAAASPPSPGTPGEGRGEGPPRQSTQNPHPNPLPEFRAREVSTGAMIARVAVVIGIVAILVGPWIYLVQKRESHFLGTSVTHDVLNRIAQPLEGHKGPPGYHLALVFATFFPWSVLLPMALVSAWQNRRDPLIRFCFAAVVGPWLMFEIVRTKLPHYLMPVFPPLALLTADVIVRCLRGEKDDLRRTGFIIAVVIIGVVAVALGGAAVGAAIHFREPVWPAAALATAACVFAILMIATFRARFPREGLLAMGFGAAVIYLVLFGIYLPRADFLHLSKRTADILIQHGATGERQVEMLDYKEPSLAFYQGGTIRENSAMALSHDLLNHAPPWLVVTSEVLAKTPPDVQARLDEIGTARGLAYADGGRVVDTIVVKQRSAPATQPTFAPALRASVNRQAP
jgi:4-amino-4-deoxy-L-arabinose transferase-like glycosyltransferase